MIFCAVTNSTLIFQDHSQPCTERVGCTVFSRGMLHRGCTAAEKLCKAWKTFVHHFQSSARPLIATSYVALHRYCLCFSEQQKAGVLLIPAMTHTLTARFPFMQCIFSIAIILVSLIQGVPSNSSNPPPPNRLWACIHMPRALRYAECPAY